MTRGKDMEYMELIRFMENVYDIVMRTQSNEGFISVDDIHKHFPVLSDQWDSLTRHTYISKICRFFSQCYIFEEKFISENKKPVFDGVGHYEYRINKKIEPKKTHEVWYF